MFTPSFNLLLAMSFFCNCLSTVTEKLSVGISLWTDTLFWVSFCSRIIAEETAWLMETEKNAVLSVGQNEEHWAYSYPLCCCLPAMLWLCCKEPSKGDCLTFLISLDYPLLIIYHQSFSFKCVGFLHSQLLYLKRGNYFWHFIFAEKLGRECAGPPKRREKCCCFLL